MAVIPPSPPDINTTYILQVLRRKSTDHDGLSAKVHQFISVATPLVDLVAAGPFRHYTLHNRDHAKKLIHLTEHLVPLATLDQLSPLECLLLVYAAFLHDMGMAVTSIERNRILVSTTFQDSIRDWPALATAYNQIRERMSSASDVERPLLELHLYQLQEAALSEYLRPLHATPQVYQELCSHLRQSANAPDLFSYRGVSFESWLIDICVSHNLDAAVLSESRDAYNDRFPRDLTIAHEKVNTQFCAAILRLSDILDFDRERTPRVLFESLGIAEIDRPGADVTLQEWEKHMAVHTLEVREDELLISAECHHPAIEKTIREFSAAIEREIRDTTAVLKRNTPDVLTRYFIELPVSVRTRITSVGYDYKDLSLRLNQSAIMSLLMGDRLYAHAGVAIRELIQNALDACDVRRRIQSDGRYSASISVSATVDRIGRTWIEVADNGIGMDEHVLSNYFLKLGDTYYDSPEFKRHFARLQTDPQPFHPISRFGIGIVSTFMLADVLEVQTSSSFSPRGDTGGRLVRIERLGGLAFVCDHERNYPGTTVRIRLRNEIASNFDTFAREAAAYLRWLVVRPTFLVHLKINPLNPFYLPSTDGVFFALSRKGKEFYEQKGYEIVTVELQRWSDRLSGVVIIVLAGDREGRLSPVKNSRKIVFDRKNPEQIDPQALVPGFRGNRLTVNGFRVKTFRTKNLLRLKNKTAHIAFMFDAEAAGSAEIEFDVSRERLTKRGENFLRGEIRATILTALADLGILERLSLETRLSLPRIKEVDARRITERTKPDALQELFDSVRRSIPAPPWPKGLHKKIAADLGISPALVSRVISTLLASGRVTK